MGESGISTTKRAGALAALGERYPGALAEGEDALLAQRREAAGLPVTGPALGLALSGGGIRSATFALGLVQALARHRLLRRFDFVSTVSGGGYIGSSLGALYARGGDATPAWLAAGAQPGERRADVVERVLADRRSKYLGWLREHGRYMSPNGSGDLLLAGAVLLRNWVAMQVVLAVAAFGVALAVQIPRFAAASALGVRPGADDTISRLGHGLFAAGGWWSPWILAPVATLLLWALPAGWAYWLVPVRDAGRTQHLPAGTVVGLFVVQAIAFLLFAPGSGTLGTVQVAGLALTLLALVFHVLVWLWRPAGKDDPPPPADPAARLAAETTRRQHTLSVWLRNGLLATAALAALAVVDGWAQTLYARHSFGLGLAWLAPPIAASAGAVAAFAQKLLASWPGLSSDRRPPLPVTALAFVAALVLLLVLLLSVFVAAHALVWRGGLPPVDVCTKMGLVGCERVGAPPLPWLSGLWIALAVTIVLNLLFAVTWSFLNQSTQAPLYGARLRRAYLGASNAGRFDDGRRSPKLDHPGDDFDFLDYRPDRAGGPLHLVNVTVNETVEGRSQVEQRDRKGTSLAFGPVGLSLGVAHHARWIPRDAQERRRRWPLEAIPRADAAAHAVFVGDAKTGAIEAEALSLGRLVAISGAAFSTGLGSRTSVGLALLLGLLNVRLGHWWKSGVDPTRRGDFGSFVSVVARAGFHLSRWFPVQRHLLDELLARFPGTARRNWYLSDGGHFENSGAYELIRRRLPLIVVADDGQDVDYAFSDLGQLARKARLDFGAEIRFASEQDLAVLHPWARRWIGTLAEIRGEARDPASGAGGARRNRKHAALAFVHYPEAPSERGSLLLWIKPSLVADEPRDVIEYALRSADFPQQTTADQFFDEAQWESYRALGETIGERLFGPPLADGDGWLPRELDLASWGVKAQAPGSA